MCQGRNEIIIIIIIIIIIFFFCWKCRSLYPSVNSQIESTPPPVNEPISPIQTFDQLFKLYSRTFELNVQGAFFFFFFLGVWVFDLNCRISIRGILQKDWFFSPRWFKWDGIKCKCNLTGRLVGWFYYYFILFYFLKWSRSRIWIWFTTGYSHRVSSTSAIHLEDILGNVRRQLSNLLGNQWERITAGPAKRTISIPSSATDDTRRRNNLLRK